MRIATFAAPLSRDGPGLLLRDVARGDDPQVTAIAAVIAAVGPDVLVLTDFDYDHDSLALNGFADLFGATFPTRFALRPNAGMATAFDLDRNGRRGDARDAQGYGRFSGDGGMAILSRYPVDQRGVIDHSALLWRDLPGAAMPYDGTTPYLTEAEAADLRLSSNGHWIVPLVLPDGPLSLMVFDATPPLFDGPEDFNGLRNRDELRLWRVVLDGGFGPVPEGFVIAGNANLDPEAGDGLRDAMAAFLADPRLQDPLPGQPTADWGDDGPGALRVSYVLPSTDWEVIGAGVFWPTPGGEAAALLGADGLAAGPHRLVWVDISR